MTDFVHCPHCNHKIKDLWDYGWSHLEETIETECGECGACGAPVAITRDVSVTYRIQKTES